MKAKRILAMLLLAILIPFSSAMADEPENNDPIPVDVETLYIGLSFGENAVREAIFRNTEDHGFLLGNMDEERHFVPEEELDSSTLVIRRETSWYMLLEDSFDSKESAEASARLYHCRVLLIDGAYRLAYGPYNSVGEVYYLMRRSAVSAEAWQETTLAVYDGLGRPLRLEPDDGDLALQAVAEGEPCTEYGGRRYRGAFLLRFGEDGRITVINAVGLEDYVKGVVPYEMSPGWPEEALKAQAICARTYGAYHVGAYAEEYGFDLTNDTESQVYQGMNGADAVTDAAVDETRGRFVRYQGELCEIYYFSSDGGATEDGKYIFGTDRPYLAGKKDPYEAAMDKFVLRWSRRFTGEKIAALLREQDLVIGPVTRIEPKYSAFGNVIAVSYYDEDGNCAALSCRESYSFLALDSARFTVAYEDGLFTFTGVGWGHNCGMSQWGAYAMADTYGKSAEEIIEFYFSGATVG